MEMAHKTKNKMILNNLSLIGTIGEDLPLIAVIVVVFGVVVYFIVTRKKKVTPKDDIKPWLDGDDDDDFDGDKPPKDGNFQ